MRKVITLLSLLMVFLLAACQGDVCPPDSIQYAPDPAHLPPPPTPAEVELGSMSEMVQIGNKMIEVDRIIHGPLCNDTWSGTIYVACDIQIVEWDQDGAPNFLDGCDLNIEPGTVVYVAAHNNAAYYRGCASCHSSQGEED